MTPILRFGSSFIFLPWVKLDSSSFLLMQVMSSMSVSFGMTRARAYRGSGACAPSGVQRQIRDQEVRGRSPSEAAEDILKI